MGEDAGEATLVELHGRAAKIVVVAHTHQLLEATHSFDPISADETCLSHKL